MDNSIDYYEAQSMAETAANEVRHQVLREVEEMFRMEREDRRDVTGDIKQGIAELNERIWNIEVFLGIRESSGKWVGYNKGESDNARTS